MRKTLFLLLKVLLIAAGLVWLLKHPGHMVVTWLDYEVELAFVTFLLGFLGIMAVLWGALSLLLWIWRMPSRLGHRYERYNAEKGFKALYGALESNALENWGRFDKETHHVENLLKEKELALYLKGEAALLQNNMALAETCFDTLTHTPKSHTIGLMGLLKVAEVRGSIHQRWDIAQKLSALAPSSRRLQMILFNTALQKGQYDQALMATQCLLRYRLLDIEKVSALQAQAYLAKEASLAQSKDLEEAYKAAEQGYNALATPETLKRYLPYLFQQEKIRKAHKLLEKMLDKTFDQNLFEDLCRLEKRLSPLEKYDFMRIFYEQKKWTQPLLSTLIQYALKSELWGDARGLLDRYAQNYGEDRASLSQRASLSLAESNDVQKALQFYQKACRS